MKTTVKSLLTIVALAATSLVIHAQDTTKPATPAAPGAPGGNNRGNYEDFRKRMEDRIKTSLKVTDDEWAVLQPLIDKVNEKQRDASGGGRGGFGGPPRTGTTTGGGTTGGTPGATGSTSTRPERAGTAEREALRLALDSEGTSTDELKNKLGAVRAVRMKSTAELATAREELKKVVTVRQEAVLVSMGILE